MCYTYTIMIKNTKENLKYLRRKPSNYAFWKSTLENSDETKDFLERGDKRQLDSLLRVINYLCKHNGEFVKKHNLLKIKQKIKQKK
jgi:hypothetical protein